MSFSSPSAYHASRLLNGVMPPFPSRAAAMNAELPRDLNRLDVLTDFGTIAYRKGPFAVPGFVNAVDSSVWGPYDEAYPDHYGDNTTPGTTDMTVAIQAAVSSGLPVRLFACTYLVSDEIVFEKTFEGGVYTAKIEGAGKDLSTILQSDPYSDTIVVRRDAATTGVVKPILLDFKVVYTPGAVTDDEGKAIKLTRCINGLISNIEVQSAAYPYYCEATGQCWFENCFYNAFRTGSENYAKSMFVFDHDPATGTGRSFGNHVVNCEANGGTGINAIFELRAVDGLYIDSGHYNYFRYSFLINPDGTGARDTILDVHSSNVYYDRGIEPTGTNQMQSHIYFAGITSGSVRIDTISIVGGIMRCAANGRALRFSPIAGDFNGLSVLRNLKFTGVTFRGYRYRALDITLPASYNTKALIENVGIIGCTFEDAWGGHPDPNNSAIVANGSNITIVGNVLEGNWTDAGSPVISIGALADNVTVVGNVMDAPRTTKISVNGAATDVKIKSNVGADDTSDAVTITSGSNYCIRYPDGRQECVIRSLVPDWTLSTTQAFSFPAVFIETPVGGITGIRSGGATGLANWATVEAYGPTSVSAYFVKLSGLGTNGSGADYTLTAFFSGRWK